MSLIVLMGPPASGKSTYAAAFTHCEIVNVDTLRSLMGLAPGSGNYDVFSAAYTITERHLRSGRTVVFDSTAITSNVRRNLRRIAKRNGRPVHLIVVHSDPSLCRARNQSRPLPEAVPHARMASMLSDYAREYPVAVGAEAWTSVRVVDGSKLAAQGNRHE